MNINTEYVEPVKTITQSEFTGISFKEADENILLIYSEKAAKRKGYVFILMGKRCGRKDENGIMSYVYGIQEYCHKTKNLGRWQDANSFEYAYEQFNRIR